MDGYLHDHHRTIREASIGLIAPKIRKDLNMPENVQQTARSIFTRALKTLDTAGLGQSRYLSGAQVSLADLGDVSQTPSALKPIRNANASALAVLEQRGV